jgi:hypothetical protein
MPGMGHSPAWWKQYEALREKGHSKESAVKAVEAAVEALPQG